ncbi:hypothetical protein BGZ51_001415 [Haplosporangium sp. Z 767]|nr:hypothetical protein BGZ51_001415 [Haplosporangium sp. Z 767]KAF9188934.1 hypothetical protein BGZ50_001084 [Haplosporangium sp. Z 11]
MPRASGFQLFDNQDNAVESGIEYFLKLANPDLKSDILSFKWLDGLWGLDGGEEPIVTCEFINGITYLKYGDEFLYIEDNRVISLTDDVPKRHERLRLVVSDEDNTFQISMWDRDGFAYVDWIKCAYGPVKINEGCKQADGMKLILSPV